MSFLCIFRHICVRFVYIDIDVGIDIDIDVNVDIHIDVSISIDVDLFKRALVHKCTICVNTIEMC